MRVGMSRSKLQVEHKERFVQTSKIYGCLQNVVPVSLRMRVLLEEHYQPTTGHPSE